MRVKQIWSFLPLPSKMKLVWDRLMFSRLTAAYIIFSLVHCILQVSLQSWAFSMNADAMNFLYGMALAGNATDNRIPAYSENEGLRLCSDVPGDRGVEIECTQIWGGDSAAQADTSSQAQGSAQEDTLFSSTLSTTPTTVTVSASTSSASASSSAISSNNQDFGAASPNTIATFVGGTPTSVQIAPTPTRSTSSISSTSSTSSPSTTLAGAIADGQALDPEEEEEEEEEFEFDDEEIGGEVESDDSDSESDLDSASSSDDSDDETLGVPAVAARAVKRALSFETQKVSEQGTVSIFVSGNGLEGVPLSKDCLWGLNWPVSILANTKREDIVFIAFQFWVLGMSIVALLNESIPHIFASLLTHVLATAWSGFQIAHTANFRRQFNASITNGVCGVQLLPDYWNARARAEYPTLALNIVALFVSCLLTWKLIKLFGWQTFKRVGASLTINRVYKLVLFLSITLQLSFFFMAATVSLWLDSLFNGVASQVAWYVPFYKASAIITAVLLVPWLVTGWFAVRKELRVPMFIFLFLSILYLAGWGTMFLASTFRWLFLTWRFFSLMASASVALTLSAFILGVVCRFNFGKGLPRYLDAHEPLPGDDFAPVAYPYGNASNDIEKVDFPSNDKPIPTYSAAFGKGPEVPPPSQMFPQGRMGPRFFNPAAQPFETPRNLSPVTVPPSTMTRPSSGSSYQQTVTLARTDSRGSEKSFGSLASFYSYSDKEVSHSRSNSVDPHPIGKRWVIE